MIWGALYRLTYTKAIVELGNDELLVQKNILRTFKSWKEYKRNGFDQKEDQKEHKNQVGRSKHKR